MSDVLITGTHSAQPHATITVATAPPARHRMAARANLWMSERRVTAAPPFRTLGTPRPAAGPRGRTRTAGTGRGRGGGGRGTRGRPWARPTQRTGQAVAP